MIVNVTLSNLREATNMDKDIIVLMGLSPILISRVNFSEYSSSPDKYLNHQLAIVKNADFYTKEGDDYKYYSIDHPTGLN